MIPQIIWYIAIGRINTIHYNCSAILYLIITMCANSLYLNAWITNISKIIFEVESCQISIFGTGINLGMAITSSVYILSLYIKPFYGKITFMVLSFLVYFLLITRV